MSYLKETHWDRTIFLCISGSCLEKWFQWKKSWNGVPSSGSSSGTGQGNELGEKVPPCVSFPLAKEWTDNAPYWGTTTLWVFWVPEIKYNPMHCHNLNAISGELLLDDPSSLSFSIILQKKQRLLNLTSFLRPSPLFPVGALGSSFPF